MLLVFYITFIQFFPVKAAPRHQEKPDYFTIYLKDGTVLFRIGKDVHVSDEYISHDNKKYSIVEINSLNKTAKAEYVEDISLPEITSTVSDNIKPAASLQENNVIGIYCTHNNESYVPSDGKASIEGNGGILDVAKTLGKELEKNSLKAIVDTTFHDPHDAGAYRRSRQTAVNIIKENNPAILFDIHRDAVPKEEYITALEGQEITMIRIVVGRSNQNYHTNKNFAYRLKAAADKHYPGLIKDIFIGKGSYNQDLHPRSLLLEFGTYTHMKERALKSASFFAEVITDSFFQHVKEDEDGDVEKDEDTKQREITSFMKDENNASIKGTIWLLIILAVGSGLFFFISSGKREAWSKIQNYKKRLFSFIDKYKK